MMSGQGNSSAEVRSNPNLVCPQEILTKIRPLEVSYLGFDGSEHAGIIEVHESVADDVLAFFELAQQISFPIEKVVRASDRDFQWDDDKLMASNASSGFNYRLVAGSDRVSLHGKGLAFDVNPRQNPYIRFEQGEKIVAPPDAVWNPAVGGTLSAEHPLVKFMLERGWDWGGNWTEEDGRIDYQHFQKRIIAEDTNET